MLYSCYAESTFKGFISITYFFRYNDLTARNIETANSDQTAEENNLYDVMNEPAVMNLNILRTILAKLKGQHDKFRLEQVIF